MSDDAAGAAIDTSSKLPANSKRGNDKHSTAVKDVDSHKKEAVKGNLESESDAFKDRKKGKDRQQRDQEVNNEKMDSTSVDSKASESSRSKRPSAQLYDPSLVLKSGKESTAESSNSLTRGSDGLKTSRKKINVAQAESEKTEDERRHPKRRGRNEKSRRKIDNEEELKASSNTAKAKGGNDNDDRKEGQEKSSKTKAKKDPKVVTEATTIGTKNDSSSNNARGGSSKGSGRGSRNSRNERKESSENSAKRSVTEKSSKGNEGGSIDSGSQRRGEKRHQQQQRGGHRPLDQTKDDHHYHSHRGGRMDTIPPRMRHRPFQQRHYYNDDFYDDNYEEEMTGPVASRTFSRSFRRSTASSNSSSHFNNEWRGDNLNFGKNEPQSEKPRTPPPRYQQVDHWRPQPQQEPHEPWQAHGGFRRAVDGNTNNRVDDHTNFGLQQQIRSRSNLAPRFARQQQQQQYLENLKHNRLLETGQQPTTRTRSPPPHRQLWNPNEPNKQQQQLQQRQKLQHQEQQYHRHHFGFNQQQQITGRTDLDQAQLTNEMRHMSLVFGDDRLQQRYDRDRQENEQQQEQEQMTVEPQAPLVSDWSVEVEEEEERRMEELRQSLEKETKPDQVVRSKIINAAPSGNVSTAATNVNKSSNDGGANEIKLASGLTFIRPQTKRSQVWSNEHPSESKNPNEGSKKDVKGTTDTSRVPANHRDALQEAWSRHQSNAFNRQGLRVETRNQHPGLLRPAFHQQRVYMDKRLLFPEPPSWYDLSDSRIYTTEHESSKVVIGHLVDSDVDGLRRLIREGGVKAVFELWDRDVMARRKDMERAFEHLLKIDLSFCVKYDIEFHVWKIAFYLLLETLKVALEEQPDIRQNVRGKMMSLIEEGINFYEGMLDMLCSTYQMDIKRYLDPLEPRPINDKLAMCVLISAQKCLLCLGDLSRYRENLKSSSDNSLDLSVARQYYQQAQSVEPRNSRPYSQLALLASMNRRKFDIVYYHIRCLSASNPIPTSKQGLTVMLDECRSRWQASQKRRLEEKEMQRREEEREKESSMLIKGSNLRKEIWIRPEGGHRLYRTTTSVSNKKSTQREQGGNYESQLRSMDRSEVNRCFVSTYLSLIATLYTNVNYESFGVAVELLLLEFRVLVDQHPLGIEAKGLTQIMAINMFIIEFTGIKEGDAQSYRSVLQTSALQLAFDMFAIIVDRCNAIIDSYRRNSNGQSDLFPDDEDLSCLLSGVKIWCDWMLVNNDTWNPVISEEPFLQLAKLATHLETLKLQMRPILSQFVNEEQYFSLDTRNRANYKLIRLQEDAILCGFKPWSRALDWRAYRRYAPLQMLDKLATDVRRMDAIYLCVMFLEGLEKPILKWSLPDSAHISLVEERLNPQERVNARLKRMLASNEEVLEETYSDGDDDYQASVHKSSSQQQAMTGSKEVSRLKQRRDELEHRHREEQRIQQEILRDHVSLILEIHPHLLVPDTNCFVDHLDHIRGLANHSHFRVCVPLTVLNELEGLSKGNSEGNSVVSSSVSRAHEVMDRARLALNFLMDASNVKCVTTSGKYLPSMRLGGASEDLSMHGQKSNDDLILETCLHLAPSNVSDQWREEKDGRRTRCVTRHVVLITDDRNLRLKAHIQDVPVITIKDFVNWAKL